MRKTVIAVVAALIGATALTGPAVAQGQTTTTAPNPAQPQGMVQLNVNTAINQTLANKWVYDAPNVVVGKCEGDKPTFTSPVLAFSNYTPGPFMGVDANISADVTLNPGTAPGDYPLELSCSTGNYKTTITVPAKQVTKVPRGAAKAGDGSMAEQTR